MFVVSAPAFVPALLLYPLVTWRAISDNLANAPEKDDDYWEVVRDWHRFSDDEASCDVQGRLFIPIPFRTKAGLERDVVTVGVGTRVEIWDPKRLDEARPDPGKAKRVAARLNIL